MLHSSSTEEHPFDLKRGTMNPANTDAETEAAPVDPVPTNIEGNPVAVAVEAVVVVEPEAWPKPLQLQVWQAWRLIKWARGVSAERQKGREDVSIKTSRSVCSALTWSAGREEEGGYNSHSPPYSPPPMGSNAGPYQQGQSFYPSTNEFPPPPTNPYGDPRGGEYSTQDYPPYNPADYPPPPGATPQPGITDPYHGMPAEQGYPNVNDTFAGDPRYDAGHTGYEGGGHHGYDGGHPGARGGAENVSPNFGNDSFEGEDPGV